jgi:mannobiose 2-epimerase
MTDHAIKYGIDAEYGGMYRDGPLDGPAMVKDKEFWQNSEALVGFLTMYQETGQQKYLDAFYNVWGFVDKHMINHELGEWKTLLTRTGDPIDPRIGNPWKACYHSGRSIIESIKRIDAILEKP